MAYQDLRLLAKMFDITQKTRIAQESMVRSAAVDPDFIAPVLEPLRENEEALTRLLRRQMRSTVAPEILQWQKDSGGIGEHLLARLLGVIGDPYIAYPRYWRKGKEGEDAKRVLVDGDPFTRRVSDLWSYCGHGDPSRKLRRGMTQQDAMALGSPEAKMLVHLLAESCMKQVRGGKATSPYREVYDIARVTYENRLHEGECIRCGPSGKPAQPGSPWSLKHQHMAALRIVGKEILRDLWRAARAAHAREDSGVSDIDLLIDKTRRELKSHPVMAAAEPLLDSVAE